MKVAAHLMVDKKLSNSQSGQESQRPATNDPTYFTRSHALRFHYLLNVQLMAIL